MVSEINSKVRKLRSTGSSRGFGDPLRQFTVLGSGCLPTPAIPQRRPVPHYSREHSGNTSLSHFCDPDSILWTHPVGGSLHAVSCHSTCYQTSHKRALPSSPGSSYTSSRDRTYLLVPTSAAQDCLVARPSIFKHVQPTDLWCAPTLPAQFPSIPIPFFWPSAPCPFQLPELSTGAPWLAPNQILVGAQIC